MLTGFLGMGVLQSAQDQEQDGKEVEGGNPVLPDGRTTAMFAILVG
jgi:hypothetical protein